MSTLSRGGINPKAPSIPNSGKVLRRSTNSIAPDRLSDKYPQLLKRWKRCSVWLHKNRAVASQGASGARPSIWNLCLPVSRLAPLLLHTSNTVFSRCGSPFCFWPLLLVFGPPKSWRRACIRTGRCGRVEGLDQPRDSVVGLRSLQTDFHIYRAILESFLYAYYRAIVDSSVIISFFLEKYYIPQYYRWLTCYLCARLCQCFG